MIRVNNHILIIVCFLLFACKPDQLKWDLPRVNPLDTMVNSSGFQPITLQPVITSNTTAKIRGQLTPYSPSFEGQVAIDWKKLGESWDRVEATQNEQGVFEVVVYDLTPGATYMSRAVMIISASSLYGEELQFSMPVDNQQLGCTDPQACNYFSAATFDDGSCTYAMLFWIDFDDDGYGDMYAPPELDCPPLPNNAVFNGDDCDDYDNTVYPNAQSTQSGIDNDCSGEIEEDEEQASGSIEELLMKIKTLDEEAYLEVMTVSSNGTLENIENTLKQNANKQRVTALEMDTDDMFAPL